MVFSFYRLSENKIGDTGAKAIGEGLESNTSLEEFSISQNQIGPNGAKTIAVALKSNHTLRTLR